MREPEPDPAFEQLFREHYPGLCAFVHGYVGDWAVAEELVQDTFFAFWQRHESLELRGNIRAYLYTAARNAAVSHTRRRVLEDRVDEESARGLAGNVPGADVELRAHELSDALDAAIDALPERARLVFTLSREGGLSYNEIAETLGISVKTVESNMARALRLLRDSLGPLLLVSGLAVLI